LKLSVLTYQFSVIPEIIALSLMLCGGKTISKPPPAVVIP
jgi:hypothetical protein